MSSRQIAEEIVFTRNGFEDQVISKDTDPVYSVKGFDDDIMTYYSSLIKLKQEDNDGTELLRFVRHMFDIHPMNNVWLFIGIHNQHAVLYFISNPDVNDCGPDEVGWVELKCLNNHYNAIMIHLAYRNAQKDSYSIYYKEFQMNHRKPYRLFYVCSIPRVSAKVCFIYHIYSSRIHPQLEYTLD